MKVYDATALTTNTVLLADGSALVSEHTMSGVMTDVSTITNVGSQDNIIDAITVLDSEGKDVTDNYEITEGDLSLTLRNRTESGTDYWKYKYSIETTDVVENGSGHGWKGVPARPFMEKGLERFAYDILEPKLNKLGGR